MNKRTIFKYALEIFDVQTIRIPRWHKFLTLQLQDGKPTLWALVNPSTETRTVEILCFGTGNPGPGGDEEYLGTVQVGGFVWHYFLAE